ncbi:MAG: hypothetical protein EXQ48_06225 [Acidobacteria bacterium]|nr:hypothetical protein [Acidobacteriota bacterium]
MRQAAFLVVLAIGVAVSLGAQGQAPAPGGFDAAAPIPLTAPPGGSVSVGPATNLRPVAVTPGCTFTPPSMRIEPDVFPVSVGTVTSTDGKQWTVPGPVADGPFAVDLYNDCVTAGDNPDWAKQLETVVIDKDGVDITGFVFADNYYELYVNGRLVARDSIGMTPFNSTAVRFRAKYPMTYAIKGIDWETKHGLGMEYQPFNIGDAGVMAYFSDGNGTHADWRAETFYVAPLDDPMCVRTAGGRDSSFCSQAVRPACAQTKPESCKAVHFPIPAAWMAPAFNDSAWPRAIVWRPVEVSFYRGYLNYAKHFGDAEFIWTRNIRLDNLVLARYTARGPRRAPAAR